MSKSLSLLLLASLITVSCTKDPTERNPHEGPIDPKVNGVTDGSEQVSAFSVLSSKISQIEKDIETGRNYEAHFKALGDAVFSSEFQDLSKGTIEEKRKILSAFNRLLIKNPSFSWLEGYQKLILSSCEYSTTQCQALRLFSEDHLSAQIFLMSLEPLRKELLSSPDSKSLARYYKLLGLVYDLSNGQSFIELDIAYTQFSSAWSRELKGHSMRQDEYRRHNDRVRLALRQIKSSKSKVHQATYCRLLNKANILSLSEGSQSGETVRVQKALLNDQILCETRAGTLTKTLQEIAKKELEPLFESRRQVSNWYKLAQKVQLNSELKPSAQLLVIDRLFHEKIDVTQAIELLSKVGGSANLLSLIADYSKIQTAVTLISTVKSFKSLIDSEKAEGTSIGLVFASRIKARLQSVEKLNWDGLNRGLSILKDLLNQGFDTRSNRGALNLKGGQGIDGEVISLKTRLGSLRQNMSFTIQQPLNFTMMYLLGKSLGSSLIAVGDIDATSKSSKSYPADQYLINELRMSHSGSDYSVNLVDIGASGSEWSSIQSLQALDWLVHIGLFEELGIHSKDFLDYVARKLFESRELTIKSALDQMAQVEKDTGLWARYDHLCKNPLTNMNESIPVQSVIGDYVSEFEMIGPLKSYYQQAQVLVKSDNDQLLMKRILSLFPEIETENGSEVRDRSESKDQIVSQLEEKEEKLLSLYKRIEQKIKGSSEDCLARIARFESLRRRLALGSFIEYFKEVRNAGLMLQSYSPQSGGPSVWTSEQRRLFSALGSPRDYQELKDRIQKRFQSNKIQSRVEFRGDLFQFSSWDTLSLTSDGLTNSVLSARDAKLLGLGQVPMSSGPNLQMRLDGKIQLDQIKEFINQTTNSIALSSSEEEFLGQAFDKIIGRSGTRQIRWLDSKDSWGQLLRSRADRSAVVFRDYGKVSPRSVLTDALGLFESLNTHGFSGEADPLSEQIFPTEKDILTLSKRSEKMISDKVELLAYLDSSDTAAWTYFDEYLRKKFLYDSSEKSDKISGSYELRTVKRVTENFLRKDYHLLPLSENVKEIEVKDRLVLLMEQVIAIAKMKKEIRRIEKEVYLPPFVIEKLEESQIPSDYVDQNWRAMTVKTRSDGSQVLLAEDKTLKIYKGLLRSFHLNETNCAFIPKSIEGSSCQAKTEKWIQLHLEN